MIKPVGMVLIGVAVVGACAWVELSDQGEAVRVARPGQVADCRRLGEATASVLDKVAFMKRSRDRQARELETLARNEAGAMGGNAIVATSDVEDGRRTFTVYRC